MLTTTLDGLWVLQVLAGIEVVAPELGLRPYLPSVESPDAAMRHPVADDLRKAGAISASGRVDSAIVDWLSVLSRREIGLCAELCSPRCADARIVMARFEHWWVCLERSDDLVRISGMGRAETAEAATESIAAQLSRLCGSNGPAAIRPITVDAEVFADGCSDPDVLRGYLESCCREGYERHVMRIACDPDRSAQASIVALQSGVRHARTGLIQVADAAVTIIDTTEGRLLAETIHSAGRRWLLIGPGDTRSVTAAIRTMLDRLPAGSKWYSCCRAG